LAAIAIETVRIPAVATSAEDVSVSAAPPVDDLGHPITGKLEENVLGVGAEVRHDDGRLSAVDLARLGSH
jgi:hypothetical protein